MGLLVAMKYMLLIILLFCSSCAGTYHVQAHKEVKWYHQKYQVEKYRK